MDVDADTSALTKPPQPIEGMPETLRSRGTGNFLVRLEKDERVVDKGSVSAGNTNHSSDSNTNSVPTQPVTNSSSNSSANTKKTDSRVDSPESSLRNRKVVVEENRGRKILHCYRIHNMSQDDIQKFFIYYAPVKAVRLIVDKEKRSKGYAFVEFETASDAAHVMDKISTMPDLAFCVEYAKDGRKRADRRSKENGGTKPSSGKSRDHYSPPRYQRALSPDRDHYSPPRSTRSDHYSPPHRSFFPRSPRMDPFPYPLPVLPPQVRSRSPPRRPIRGSEYYPLPPRSLPPHLIPLSRPVVAADFYAPDVFTRDRPSKRSWENERIERNERNERSERKKKRSRIDHYEPEKKPEIYPHQGRSRSPHRLPQIDHYEPSPSVQSIKVRQPSPISPRPRNERRNSKPDGKNKT